MNIGISFAILTLVTGTFGATAQLTDPFPPLVSVSSLDGNIGFSMTDSSLLFANARLGRSLTGLGDIDGDGISDFAAAASDASSSRVRVVFGGSSLAGGSVLDLNSLPSTQTLNVFGEGAVRIVGFVGDINGDGLAEIAFTGPSVAYVIFGSAELRNANGSFSLATLDGSNGFIFTGLESASNRLPDISGVGDINHDGFQDFAVGSPLSDGNGSDSGRVHVVYGGTMVGASGAIAASSLNGAAGFTINGVASDDAIGTQVSGGSDINGDGIDDLVLGGEGDLPSASRGERTYVVYGATGLGSSGSFNLSLIDGSNGFVIGAGTPGDRGGAVVESIGDVNNDGLGDVLVAFPNWSSFQGRVMVVFGSEDDRGAGPLNPEDLDGSNGFLLVAEDYDSFGTSAAPLGDVNNDNIDDFIVGAPFAQVPGLNTPGACVVVFGSTNLGATGLVSANSFDGTNGFVVTGSGAEDQTGASVALCGDINEDGVNDILIGVPRAGSFDFGRLDVVLGRLLAAMCPVDVDGDGRIDIDDLYYITQHPTDINGDGVADYEDAACLERYLRRNELEDMTAGRR